MSTKTLMLNSLLATLCSFENVVHLALFVIIMYVCLCLCVCVCLRISLFELHLTVSQMFAWLASVDCRKKRKEFTCTSWIALVSPISLDDDRIFENQL